MLTVLVTLIKSIHAQEKTILSKNVNATEAFKSLQKKTSSEDSSIAMHTNPVPKKNWLPTDVRMHQWFVFKIFLIQPNVKRFKLTDFIDDYLHDILNERISSN